MKALKIVGLIILLALTAKGAGAVKKGAKKPKPKPTPTVTVTASPTVVQYGQYVQLTATVTGAKKFSVKWSQHATGLVGSGSFEPSSTVPNPKWTVVPVDQRATVTFFAKVTATIKKQTQTLDGSTTVTIEPAKLSEAKASPAKVKPGQWVNLSVTITGSGGALPEWTTSNPKYQQGFEQGNRGTAVSWKAQPVNQPTSVDFIAKASIAGFITIQVSTSVTVEPVVAEITVVYPSQPQDRVVGYNTILTAELYVIPGSSAVERIRVSYQNLILAETDGDDPYAFLDLTGWDRLPEGELTLTVEAIATDGSVGKTTLVVNHNRALLNQLTDQYVKKYVSWLDGVVQKWYSPNLKLLVDNKLKPYLEPIGGVSMLEQTSKWYARYPNGPVIVEVKWTDTPLSVMPDGLTPDGYIIIMESFGQRNAYAGTSVAFATDTGIGSRALIEFYQPPELERLDVLIHELGHIFVAIHSHTENGSFMDNSPLPNIGFHPYMQLIFTRFWAN